MKVGEGPQSGLNLTNPNPLGHLTQEQGERSLALQTLSCVPWDLGLL